MVIAPAFESHVDERSETGVLGAKLDDAQREALIHSIRDRGIDYVAQEAVTLSSMPVWRDGRLQPRPFTLRLFLAKVGDRWQVMPGGFVRIADTADARAVSLQRGAATADAWVLARGPVGETTLLPAAERIEVQRASGLLPSRAADNLFWVGRYVERAEATLRLVRAHDKSRRRGRRDARRRCSRRSVRCSKRGARRRTKRAARKAPSWCARC